MRKASKYIFMDRDGVINVDAGNGYIDHWGKFRFLAGSLPALRLLTEKGYKVVVISNQAGIAKGFYSLKDLREMTRRMQKRIESRRGKLSAVYYCPHRREDRCPCRKPKTGLFRRAQRRFGMTFRETPVIGDSMVDIRAGKTLRCPTVLVLSGREKLSRRKVWEVQPDTVQKNLLEAVRWVLRREVEGSNTS